MRPDRFRGDLKRADLTSSLGAGVLGGGLALLAPRFLAPYAVALLLAGALLHGWGMYDKHRLERAAGEAPPRWAEALYWLCWVALAALAAWIVLGARR